MATEPRYTFDPVTQTYTRVDTPPAPITGLGPLYDVGGSGSQGVGPSGSRGPGQGVSSTAQTIGLGGLAYGNLLGGFVPGGTLANMVGGAIADQQLGALNAAQSNLSAMDQSPGRSMGIATVSDPEGNTYGRSSPETIAAANMATFGVPDATVGLASMNAQVAAQNQAAAQQAQVANTAQSVASSVAQDVADFADTTDAEAGAAVGTTDSGTTSDGGGGGGGSPDSGGFDVGDSTNSDATGESSDAYAEGGLASARKTEDMGRGNDTMLVHMTPNEVRGLQAIAMAHGGSLTINPKTGLVEAGFLDSILPVVAGAALNMAVPGLGAAMGGFAIPALVGGASYLMNPKQGLMGGIMAGLSAYGGQSIASGLVGAESMAAKEAGIQGANSEIARQAAGATKDTVYNEALIKQAQADAAKKFAEQSTFDQLGQNVKLIGSQPIGQTIAGLGGKMAVGAAAAPVISSMFSAEEPNTGNKPQEYVRPYSFDFKPSAETNPDFRFRTGKPGESTAEQRYFSPAFTGLGVYKAGTEPGPSFYGTPTQDQLKLYSGPKPTGLAMANGGVANFDDEPGYDDDSMATGGLTAMAAGGLKDGAFVVPADVVSHLGNGSNDAGQKLLARGLGAKPIKGKGDGMSDSIPTTIEGKQPARVADGEAYIPPEVVKKVGAKRLYSMMDKIRHARTGTKRQAPEVDPRKFLPA